MRWPWSKKDDDIYQAIHGIAESACPSDVIEFGRRAMEHAAKQRGDRK
jgi:hypothetical protein